MNRSKLREVILAFLLAITLYVSFCIAALDKKATDIDTKVDSLHTTIK